MMNERVAKKARVVETSPLLLAMASTEAGNRSDGEGVEGNNREWSDFLARVNVDVEHNYSITNRRTFVSEWLEKEGTLSQLLPERFRAALRTAYCPSPSSDKDL
jgi:hypothetical protein